jgi:tryptophan synthase beta chain
MAPMLSHAVKLGLVEGVAKNQLECFQAGLLFARNEGIFPAPESTHAVRAAIDEALRAKQEGVRRTILFNLSGHGHFDMQAYQDYMAGKLKDLEYDPKELAMALAGLPSVGT